jgi:hypothetical protein
VRKETNDKTRKRIEKDLKSTTAFYADCAENEMLKLQQAYSKKHHPVESHSSEVLQRAEDVRNKRFGGKVSALFRGWREDLREPELAKQVAKAAMSEEGISEITHAFQVSLLSQPSELVFNDKCRFVVSLLNRHRWIRIEDLEDGYHVSSTLCYNDIDSCYVGTQCLEELVFTPTIKDVLTKYMDGMMSVLLGL